MVGKTLVLTLCLATVVFTAADDRRLVDAAQRGDIEALKTLVKQKIDVNAPQGDGMTALHWAAFNDDLDAAALLVGAGANVKAATRIGAITPLLIAAKKRQPGDRQGAARRRCGRKFRNRRRRHRADDRGDFR